MFLSYKRTSVADFVLAEIVVLDVFILNEDKILPYLVNFHTDKGFKDESLL